MKIGPETYLKLLEGQVKQLDRLLISRRLNFEFMMNAVKDGQAKIKGDAKVAEKLPSEL